MRGALCFLAIVASTTPGLAAEVVTIAGTGRDGYRGDGGLAIAAEIGQPFGLTVGPDGALYVCSVSHHAIRRIELSSGRISTVAGRGSKGYSGDGGPAIRAQLNEPYEIQFDA